MQNTRQNTNWLRNIPQQEAAEVENNKKLAPLAIEIQNTTQNFFVSGTMNLKTSTQKRCLFQNLRGWVIIKKKTFGIYLVLEFALLKATLKKLLSFRHICKKQCQYSLNT